MGQSADDAIEGFACSWCGAYFSESHGYPVLCTECWSDSRPQDRGGLQRATNPRLGELSD